MKVNLGFEAHQPLRINSRFDESEAKGKDQEELFDHYFDREWNREILERVAEKCYLPANEIILENIKRYSGEKKEFKLSYSISGDLVFQCEKWCPDVLESFQKLANTGNVEFLDQTYYHSLASLFSSEPEEFIEQIEKHREMVEDLIGQKPKVFENTEFIYNNSIAKVLEKMGYEAVFTEGSDRVLGWRSPNYVYKAKDADIKVFPRNYVLSDDIGFRFSNRDWPGWPLTADKYSEWLSKAPGQCLNLFIDYETFGEHQWPETGIYEFLSFLPGEILKHDNLEFVTPSELADEPAVGDFDVNEYDTISWADEARSISAWMSNPMQEELYQRIKGLESKVRRAGNEKLLQIWRFFQTSDLLYYMYTKPGSSREVHNYFSQKAPTEVYKNFSRILSDFEKRINSQLDGTVERKSKEKEGENER